jgi:hypothetical protein
LSAQQDDEIKTGIRMGAGFFVLIGQSNTHERRSRRAKG